MLSLLALQLGDDGRNDYDVVSAPYPIKRVAWDIARPLEVERAGTGFMMIRRETLERFQAHYPQRRYKSDNTGIQYGCAAHITQFFDTASDGHAETLAADLRQFMQENPAADHDAILHYVSSRAPAGGEYIPECSMFCRLVRRMGLRLWSCPWMVLSHTGSFTFTGDLRAQARLGPRQA